MSTPETILGGHAIRNEQMDADISVALGTSKLIDVSRATMIGVELRTNGGTHVGIISFRMINHKKGVPIARSIPTVTVANGVALNEFVEITDLTCMLLEVFYDRTSGDGLLNALVYPKPRDL